MAALVIERLVNVATPLTAVTVAVPPSVVPPGFVPSPIVTLSLKQVCVFPELSCAVTLTVIGEPAAVVTGCVVKLSALTVQTPLVLSEWHVTTSKARAAADPARARRTKSERRA